MGKISKFGKFTIKFPKMINFEEEEKFEDQKIAIKGRDVFKMKQKTEEILYLRSPHRKLAYRD